MGVVNVTPDSFSDGGRYLAAEDAIAHGRELAAEGADILDIGGESTRPGAAPIAAEEELRRVLPVIEGLANCGPQVSIDTSKAAVARAALRAGAGLVNDVTALRGDPDMVEALANSGADCCLMHMLGEPRTMQVEPRYEDVVDDVKAFLAERLEFAIRAGVAEERIVLDPGIGFGKTVAHNLTLLRRLDEFAVLGRPLLVGTSRKGFLGRILAGDVSESLGPLAGDVSESPGPDARLPATIATCVLAYERGARILRVHDVAAVRGALATAAATLGA
jgi:dihydropteroate synthase